MAKNKAIKIEKRYLPVPGSRLSKKDAAVYGPALVALGPRITPPKIIRAAKPVRSPLHPYFEWDDQKAGLEYRLWQARHLQRAIQIVVVQIDQTKKDEAGRPEEVIVRRSNAFWNVRDNGDQVYVEVGEVNSNPDYRDQIIEYYANRSKHFADQVRQFVEFQSIVAAIDAFLRSRTKKSGHVA